MIGSKDKNFLRSSALFALVAGLTAFGGGAQAEQAEAPKPEDKKEAVKTTNQEEVVITGSRIRRDNFNSTSPVEVITNEQSQLRGQTDTAEILQGSPAAAGSQQITSQFTGFVTEGGPGVNTLSLRGLGPTRTLVLLNGRRLNPAGTRGQVGAVDLNVLPESIIDRIEILKDGASSVYGSDAVAGVVNVITRTNVDGAVISGQTNQTFEGGGAVYQFDGTWGRTFDKGQFNVSFEWNKREELTMGDRDYLSCSQDLVYDINTGGQRDIIDPATGQSKCFNLLVGVYDRLATGGRFKPGAVAAGSGLGGLNLNIAGQGYERVGLTYAQVAALFPTGTPATTIEAAWRESQAAVPTDDPLYKKLQAFQPVERATIFTQFSYDLTPNVELYSEAFFNRRESEQKSFRQIFPNVAATNPFNPFGQLSRSIVQVPTDGSQKVDTWSVVAGLRGDLNFGGFLDGWSYDIYGKYGASEGSYTNDIIPNDRVESTIRTTGTIAAPVCTMIAGSISTSTCVPVNLFRASTVAGGGFTPAEQSFLFIKETGNTTYKQTLFEGSINGDLFDLPAGPLSAVLGFHYRKEEIDDTPGFNARNNNLWGQTSAGRTAGSDTVREAFTEVEAPILRGVPLAEQVTLNASARYTDYDSYGSNETYKLGLNWAITPQYRVRGSFGTSYRAPALYELFLANQTAFIGNSTVDPCNNWGVNQNNPTIRANCQADGIPPTFNNTFSSATTVTGGGKGILEAETSEATTIGLIWTPDFLDLSIALDYFDIKIFDQVAQFGAANIVSSCYSDPGFRTGSPFCQLFTRNLTPGNPEFGRIGTINNSYVNLNQQVTKGLDLTATYRHEFSFGTLRTDLQATWTFKDEIEFFSVNPALPAPRNDFNGEVFNPDFVGSLDLRFDRKDWTFFWNVDVIGKTSLTEEFLGDQFAWRGTPGLAYYKQHTEFHAEHSTSVRYRTDQWTLQGGIQNVFNEEPPTFSTGNTSLRRGNTPIANQYDILGRRAFVSVTRRF
ncbi:MAG: TonB-dependent receptor plug domain-containing protein [Caulobacterales bacterium]